MLLLGLALLARPLDVAATLGPFRLRRGERAFIAWSGLKGAVPILLAAFALLDHIDGAGHVYGLVFVVVLLSVLGQGTLVPFVAARCEVPIRERASLPWELSMQLEEQPQAAHEFVVRKGSRAEGLRISDLPLGPTAWLALVVSERFRLASKSAGDTDLLRAGREGDVSRDRPGASARGQFQLHRVADVLLAATCDL